MRLALAAVLAAVLAVPAAADFPAAGTYLGTLKLDAKVTISGTKPQKKKDKNTSTYLDLRGDLGKYTFRPADQTITGPMTAGSKPGRFDAVQPTGQDYADLISGTESYFASTQGIDVDITDIQVSGTHTMLKNGAAAKSKILLVITGTASALHIPFTANAKLKFKGKATS